MHCASLCNGRKRSRSWRKSWRRQRRISQAVLKNIYWKAEPNNLDLHIHTLAQTLGLPLMMWPQTCHGKHVLSLCQERGNAKNSQESEVRSDFNPQPWVMSYEDSRARGRHMMYHEARCCALMHGDAPIGACRRAHTHTHTHMAMDQYLLIPFLGEWTSIYQLFWCSPGVPGFWHTAILIYMRRDAHWSGKAWISGQEIGKGHDCTILCPCLPWGNSS